MTSVTSEFDLTALLGDEPFVRGLAKGLLFDDHQVDDVVQQTWLEALKARRVTRGWLGTVVRSRASNLRRDRQRALSHERAAARVEALPSTAQLLEREELRRRVVEAVAGLPDKYRVVVLLRFYEDLPIRKIAVELDVPRETAATRLKRGLALLRERLDAAHGGDRRAWATALVPFALPPLKAIGVGGALVSKVGTLTGTFLAMKHLLFAVAGLAALLIGFGYATDLFSSEHPDPVTDTPALVTTGVVEAAPAVERVAVGDSSLTTRDEVVAARAGSGSRFASVREATCGFTGRIVSPQGEPAADELVRLIGLDPVHGLGSIFDPDRRGAGIVDSGTRTASTRTDAKGVFTIQGVRRDALFALHAAVGGEHPTWSMVSRTAGPGQLVDLGVITLIAKGGITGTVVDDDGEPIEGADVWAADIPGGILSVAPVDRLHADGAMLLAIPRLDLTLSADAATLRRYHGEIRSHLAQMVPVADDTTEFVPLDLPQWFERFFDELPLARARTEADGTFVLRGVDPGGAAVMVHADGYLDATKPRVLVRANSARDLGTIRLRAGDTCAGVVLDARGEPIRTAELRVASQPPVGLTGILFAGAAVRVGSDGHFEFRGLPREDLYLVARRDVGGPWTVHGPFDSADEEITIQFAAPCSPRISVRSAAELPIDGVHVIARRGPPLGELSVSGMQRELPVRVTAEGGDAIVHDLEPGGYTFQVTAANHALSIAFANVGATDEGVIEVELQPLAPGVVRVVDEGGTPIEGAQVFVQPVSTPAWARSVLYNYGEIRRWDELARFAGFSDASGALELDCVPAGELAVSVRHPAFGASSLKVAWPAEDVTLTLQSCGRVFGQVFDHGMPVSGEEHRLIAKPRGDRPPMPTIGGQAVVGPDGSYSFEGLPAGLYEIRVKPSLREVRTLGGLIGKVEFGGWDWLNNERAIEVEVLPGGEHEVSFDIDESIAPPGHGGRIQLHVRVDGQPALGFKVVKEEYPLHELGVLDASGSFLSAELVAGSERIGVHSPDRGSIWSGEVTIVARETTTLEVAIEFAEIRGQILRVGGVPAANHQIYVYTDYTAGGRATTPAWIDANGSYAVRVPAGNCMIWVEGVGGSIRTERFAVGPGSTVTRNLQLTSKGMITGTVISGEFPMKWVAIESDGWRQISSLDEGRFSASDLEAGTFKIELMDADFTRYQAIPGEITIGETGVLDQVLRVGELAK